MQDEQIECVMSTQSPYYHKHERLEALNASCCKLDPHGSSYEGTWWDSNVENAVKEGKKPCPKCFPKDQKERII